MKIVHDDGHQKRAAEYPSVQAQLNVIWKALASMKTKPWPPEVQAMLDQMAAVDRKYPL